MADHTDLIVFLKKWEGGATGDPRDTSAAKNPSPCGNDPKYNAPYHTNKGITWATYSSTVLGANCQEFMAMPDAVWGMIWKKYYWDKVGGDQIRNQAVANAYSTWAWGSGVSGANDLMRKMLKQKYGYKDEQVFTLQQRIAILNTLSEDDMPLLFDNLYQTRKAFFESLPNFSVYGNGWMRRLNEWRTINYAYIYVDLQIDGKNVTKGVLYSLIALAVFLIAYYFLYK